MALAKLQKTLCDKWDFIYMQAQEQLRLAINKSVTEFDLYHRMTSK